MLELSFRKSLFSTAVLALMLAAGVNGTTLGQQRPPGPEQVAQKLYLSWRTKKRRAAAEIATKEAVDKLFDVRWRAMRFEGCQRKEEGGWQCVYRDRKNDFSVAMEVDGGVSAGGYNVVSVSFSTEAI